MDMVSGVSCGFHDQQCRLSVHVELGTVRYLAVDGDLKVPFPLTDEILSHWKEAWQPGPYICWVHALYALASHKAWASPC